MGIFDKAKDLAAEHADQVEQGVDKAGDALDERTGGKYAEHVDQGQQLAKDHLLGDREQQPPA